MKLFIHMAMLTILGSGAQVFATDYDTIITCQDSPQTPTKTIELKLKSFSRNAVLKYQGKEADDFLQVTIQDSHGIYSSSEVSIKNGSRGGYGGARTLSISAHHTEVFRVTNSANFSLELEEDAQGVYKAINLYMSRGTLEYPDNLKHKSEEFENMSCVITRVN